MTKNQKIILALLSILLLFFIFFRLGRADMANDDGHYAFRALHYFDYLGSYTQSTPVQWFDYRPWWSLLSFHDHPPAYFFIQHIFFTLFGASFAVSRLTSALAAIGSAMMVFCISRRKGYKVALLSLGALVLNNYFIWTGRIGLLESLLVFFSLVGILYLRKAEDDNKYFLHAGFFFGLALLSKLSFIFIAIGLISYYLFRYFNKASLDGVRSKNFRLGAVIFLITISPYIIYNLEAYRSRGHFDVQMSDLLLPHEVFKADWSLLSPRLGGGQILENMKGIAGTISDGYSIPYSVLLLASLAYLLYRSRKSPEEVDLMPLFVLGAILLIFSFIGSESSWLGITAPFAALIIGQALALLPRSIFADTVLTAFAIYSAFYIINSNLLTISIGTSQISVASMRQENRGFRQLDERVSKLYVGHRSSTTTAEIVRRGWYSEFRPDAIDFSGSDNDNDPIQNALVVYDLKMSWFNKVWILDRWKFYNKFLIVNSEEFVQSAMSLKKLDTIGRNIDEIYFIEASPKIEEESGIISIWTPRITQVFQAKKVIPEVIMNDKGEPAFNIYHGKLKEIFDRPVDVR